MFVVAYVDCAKNKVAVLDTKDNVTEEIAVVDFCSLVQSGAVTVENAMVTDDKRVLGILAPDKATENMLEIDVAYPNDEESIKTSGYLVDKTAGTVSKASDVSVVELSLYCVPYITDEWVRLFVEPMIDSESLIGEELKEFKSDASRAKDMEAVAEFVHERHTFLQEYNDDAEEASQNIAAAAQAYEAELEKLNVLESEPVESEAESVAVNEAEPAKSEAVLPEEGVSEGTEAEEALQAVADRFTEASSEGTADEAVEVEVNPTESETTKEVQNEPEAVGTAVEPVKEEVKPEIEAEIATEDASDALKAFANRYSDDAVPEEASKGKTGTTKTSETDSESEVSDGELESVVVSTAEELIENVSPEKEVKEMATKTKKSSEVKPAKAKKAATKSTAKSPAKVEKAIEQGIVTSKKFTLRGQKYLCEIKTENFENGKDKLILSKTCSDFMYFCGNDAEVFMPEVCLSDIQLKDKVLSVADAMLNGYVFDSKGTAVSLYDVCVGKNKALQVFRPYAPELGVYNEAAKKIVIFVTAL